MLRSQGLPIPTCLPLTSVEKKALQMVRRRLKAKVRMYVRTYVCAYYGYCMPIYDYVCVSLPTYVRTLCNCVRAMWYVIHGKSRYVCMYM